MIWTVLLGDVAVNAAQMHLNSRLVVLQHLQFLIQFHLAVVLSAFEGQLVEVLRASETEEFAPLPILLHLAIVLHDEAVLIFNIEFTKYF